MYNVKYPLWILNKIVDVLSEKEDLLDNESLSVVTYNDNKEYKVDKEYTKNIFINDKYGNKYKVTVEVLEGEDANAI